MQDDKESLLDLIAFCETVQLKEKLFPKRTCSMLLWTHLFMYQFKCFACVACSIHSKRGSWLFSNLGLRPLQNVISRLRMIKIGEWPWNMAIGYHGAKQVDRFSLVLEVNYTSSPTAAGPDHKCTKKNFRKSCEGSVYSDKLQRIVWYMQVTPSQMFNCYNVETFSCYYNYILVQIVFIGYYICRIMVK